jgi:hypothetical protein
VEKVLGAAARGFSRQAGETFAPPAPAIILSEQTRLAPQPPPPVIRAVRGLLPAPSCVPVTRAYLVGVFSSGTPAHQVSLPVPASVGVTLQVYIYSIAHSPTPCNLFGEKINKNICPLDLHTVS